MRPPMMTVASGFCTYAPAPWPIAIGTKPRLATSAVMATGRRRAGRRTRPILIEIIFRRTDPGTRAASRRPVWT